MRCLGIQGGLFVFLTGLPSVEGMVALGATLGTLLAIALALLALISYKYYKLKKQLEKKNLQVSWASSSISFYAVEFIRMFRLSSSCKIVIMVKMYC